MTAIELESIAMVMSKYGVTRLVSDDVTIEMPPRPEKEKKGTEPEDPYEAFRKLSPEKQDEWMRERALR